MIKVDIVIRELPASKPQRKHGSIECKVNSITPTDEEVHMLARLFEKIREIATEVASWDGGAANIVEFGKPEDVRPSESEGDRGTDQDRQTE